MFLCHDATQRRDSKIFPLESNQGVDETGMMHEGSLVFEVNSLLWKIETTFQPGVSYRYCTGKANTHHGYQSCRPSRYKRYNHFG